MEILDYNGHEIAVGAAVMYIETSNPVRLERGIVKKITAKCINIKSEKTGFTRLVQKESSQRFIHLL